MVGTGGEGGSYYWKFLELVEAFSERNVVCSFYVAKRMYISWVASLGGR